jgi:hypothetical protein
MSMDISDVGDWQKIKKKNAAFAKVLNGK